MLLVYTMIEKKKTEVFKELKLTPEQKKRIVEKLKSAEVEFTAEVLGGLGLTDEQIEKILALKNKGMLEAFKEEVEESKESEVSKELMSAEIEEILGMSIEKLRVLGLTNERIEQIKKFKPEQIKELGRMLEQTRMFKKERIVEESEIRGMGKKKPSISERTIFILFVLLAVVLIGSKKFFSDKKKSNQKPATGKKQDHGKKQNQI